jgi:hypothetical protein
MYGAPSELTIDGAANEAYWSEADEGFVNYNLGGEGVLNPTDLDYSFKSLYNDSMFYFFIEVSDDDPTQIYPSDDPGDSWKWESVELYFLLKKNVEVPNDEQGIPEHFQMRFSPLYGTSDSILEGHGFFPDGTDIWGGQLADTMFYKHVKWEFQETLAGYKLEMSFPWDMLKIIKPEFSLDIQQNDYILFDIEIRDYDGSAGESTPSGRYSWNRDVADGPASWSTYNHLGKLIFGEYLEPVSARENTISESLVYPNPSSGMINIKNSSDIRSIQVVDLTGKIQMNLNHGEFNGSIDVSALKNGVYFLKAEMNNNGQITTKFIKQ